MADVIGLVASIYGIIQLSGKLTQVFGGYIGGVKRAPEDIKTLRDELDSLTSVLNLLEKCAKENPLSTALQDLCGQDKALSRCKDELEKLQNNLVPPKSGLRGVIDRLKWPLKEKETSQYISQIRGYTSAFNLVVSTVQVTLSKEIKEYVIDTNSTAHSFQTDAKSWREKESFRHMTGKRNQVLTWLYSKAYDTHHISIKDRRKEGTGNWLFEGAVFQGWKSGKTPVLWAHGIPGAGKTFLSSIVIDHLLAEARTSNYGVAYIYFDYKEQNQQRPIDILCCVVKQLATQLPLLELPPKLLELYDNLKPAEKRPNSDELEAALYVISKSFTRTFIICDAVDECDQAKQRERLLPLFQRLGGDGISLLLTSRPHPEDIQEAFENVPQINISAQEEDLYSYIRDRICKTPRAKKLIQGSNIKDQIVSKVANSANGMFLLAHFYIEHICKLTTMSQIREALKQIENESTNERPLDLLYDRAVEDIRRKSPREVELALKIFSWLTTARRTLTVDELRVAVSIERDKHQLDYLEELPLATTLIDVCSSLVIIDHSIIRLAHYTVHEYLLRKESTIQQELLPEKTTYGNADFKLATSCIAYLSLDVFREGACTSEVSFVGRLERHPLLDYAARHLHSHLKCCDEQLTTDEFLGFLECHGKMSCYLQVAHSSAYSRYGHDWYPKGIRPIHIASRVGHKAAAQRLLQEPSNVDAVDDDGRTPLHMAAENGDIEMLRVLDERGVNVQVACKGGRTPLHMASDSGDIKTVCFLGGKGADIGSKDKNGRIPLHMAAENGHNVVVQFLIDNGADVNTTDHHGWSPLHLASRHGHLDTVQFLLKSNSDVKITDNIGWTPLLMAVENGNIETVRFLVEMGADVKVIDNDKWTPLHMAAENGDIEMARVLEEKGANVDATDSDYWTPLRMAAKSGDIATIRFLEEKGANVNVIDIDGGTPLHMAAQTGNFEVVRFLAEKGTDIKATNNAGRTPLHMAARNRDLKTVQFLVEQGADVMATDNDGRTPLHMAAENGDIHTVRYLRHNGANVKAADNDGQTPLHTATRHGDLKTLNYLGNCADVRAADNQGQTPLHIAAQNGNISALHFLGEKGANVNEIDKNGRAPLHLATLNGHLELIRILEGMGADTEVTDYFGRHALHIAARNGDIKTVRVLEDLKKGADMTTKDGDGWTYLHMAAWNGHIEIVRFFEEKGAEVDVTDNCGRTPLYMAAENGYIDTVRFLQEKGANVQRVDMNGRSSLFMAAQNGHIETVRFLSDSGTDVRMSIDEDGWTPLHMASWNGHLETVRFLVEKGIDAGVVAKNGWTPLHMAVENGDVKTVQFLEGLTADVRVAGRTKIPLYRAILFLLVIFVIGAVLYIFYSG